MEKITKIETVEVAISRNGISQAVRFGNVLFVSGQVMNAMGPNRMP